MTSDGRRKKNFYDFYGDEESDEGNDAKTFPDKIHSSDKSTTSGKHDSSSAKQTCERIGISSKSKSLERHGGPASSKSKISEEPGASVKSKSLERSGGSAFSKSKASEGAGTS
ncbi:hypothetical protein ElyMa_002332000, partial [Elysia marginata]